MTAEEIIVIICGVIIILLGIDLLSVRLSYELMQFRIREITKWLKKFDKDGLWETEFENLSKTKNPPTDGGESHKNK